MFGLPDVVASDVPDDLKIGPRIDKCTKCGRPIMWCRRSDTDELGSPIELQPTRDGNLVIIGFTATVRTRAVVPHVRAVTSLDDLPDLTMLPAWAERKRWFHHAPFCKMLIRTPDMPSRNIDDDPELLTAFYRTREQANRQRFIGNFLRQILMIMPKWIPSKGLSDAFTQYELGTINLHLLKAAITYETGFVDDFKSSDTERRKTPIYRRPRK